MEIERETAALYQLYQIIYCVEIQIGDSTWNLII